MTKRKRITLRRGARSAQQKMLAQIEEIERRLRIARKNADDALTVEKAIDLVLDGNLSAIKAFFIAEYEDLTADNEKTSDAPDVRAQIEELQARIDALETSTLHAIPRRDRTRETG